MMTCPSCNTECPDTANFCHNCGTPLKSKPDSSKHTINQSESLVSDETMTRILKRLMPTSYTEKLFASKGKMQGERRVVTILFSDVKGSTEIAENLDPEEVLELMNGAFNVLIKPIMKYEGTIARLMGDAILAFFGAPIAHEDDPYRACRAALDILKGARKFSRKIEDEKGIKGFEVRVGINTGLVVVAEVGTDFRVEYTAMGDEVNVASRMESSAEPGTILITEATRNLIKNDFELLSLGPIQVKGKSEPVNTYRILDVKRSGNIHLSGSIFISPLIGRERELDELRDAFRNLSQGTGSIASVIGDSGLGKSRLVSEIRKTEYSQFKWVETRALTYTVNNSYWMIRGILKNFLGFHQESLDPKILDTLYKRVRTLFEDKSNDIYPYIERFLLPSLGSKEIQILDLNNVGTAHGQFHYSVKEFLKKEANEKPVVLVWEDLQWCDASSMDLINYLLPLVYEVPVLFLFVYRINEIEKSIWNFHHKNLSQYINKHRVIPVHPFDEKYSISLINNIIGDRDLPLEIQRQIIDKTEGNPSYLEEVVRSFVELGHLTVDNPVINQISFTNLFHIPVLLQNSIMARIDNLEQSDKIILQTASVIGRIFQEKILRQVLEEKFTATELEKSLNELQLKEFILRHLPTNISSGIIGLKKEYIFKQEIVWNVVYNSLLMSHRQSLHKQIGEVIESLHNDNFGEFADSLADHFERGKVNTKAIYYYRMGADRAKDLYANKDAVFFYSKVLTLSKELDMETLEIAKIYESLGDIYSVTAEYSKALNHLNISVTYDKSPGFLARIYYKCGQIFERWGRYEEAIDNYNQGLSLSESLNEKILTANIYAGMGMVFYRQGNLSEAVIHNSQALLIFKEIGNQIDIANVYNNMGIIYSKLGDLDKSFQFLRRCLEIREEAGISYGLASANNNLGYLYQIKNELDKSIEYYNKSLEYWEKMGNLHGLARTYDNLSQVYIAQGKKELGMDYNLKAITIMGKIAGESSLLNSELWLQSGVW